MLLSCDLKTQLVCKLHQMLSSDLIITSFYKDYCKTVVEMFETVSPHPAKRANDVKKAVALLRTQTHAQVSAPVVRSGRRKKLGSLLSQLHRYDTSASCSSLCMTVVT